MTLNFTPIKKIKNQTLNFDISYKNKCGDLSMINEIIMSLSQPQASLLSKQITNGNDKCWTTYQSKRQNLEWTCLI